MVDEDATEATVYVVVGPDLDPRLAEALATARPELDARGLKLMVVKPDPELGAAARARALIGEGTARGVFWLDPQPHELRVFLLAADGSAYVRRVPVEPGGDEASLEAVWHIVASGSLALASGEGVAMEQAATDEIDPAPQGTVEDPAPAAGPSEVVSPPGSAPTPAEEPDPVVAAAAPRTRVGVGYVGEGIASSMAWQSGVGVDAMVRLSPRWRLSVGYAVMVPRRRDTPTVTWRHGGSLRAGPSFDVGRRLALYGLVGVGVEAVGWRGRSAAQRGWRVVGTAGADGGLSVMLVPSRLALVVEPGLGVVLNRFDLVECEQGAVACEGETRRVVMSPWRVRPRARAGLAVFF